MNKQGGIMSKQCVLISIRPQWCEKIANREKTLEIRKSRPKIPTPFKCYIYCTQDKEHTLFKDWIDPPFVVKEYNIMNGKGGKNVFGDNRPWGNANGKVIGEFVCDQIYQYSTGNIEGQTISSEEMQKQSCLTYDELSEYENSAEPRENCIYLMGLYGWHISALQIYDKPRELGEFHKPIMPMGLRYEDDAIKRPFQSWGYVEEYDGKR